MQQVPFALKFAGYNFEKDILTKLFGSINIPNEKTAKILRDEVSHTIKDVAVVEINARREELFRYMDTFLQTIKNFDEDVA